MLTEARNSDNQNSLESLQNIWNINNLSEINKSFEKDLFPDLGKHIYF